MAGSPPRRTGVAQRNQFCRNRAWAGVDAYGEAPSGARTGGTSNVRGGFGGRCLPFDECAVLHYAAIVAQRKCADRPISTEDAQITAIALTHDLTLATRNVFDFEGIDGLQIANPWLTWV